MEISWLVLLVLFPGVLAMKLRDAVTGTGKREFKDAVLSSAVYVMVVYGLLMLVSLAKALGMTPIPIGVDFNPWTVAMVILLAVVVGLASGVVDEKRWMQKAARFFNMTHRGWRNAWADAFADARGSWVNVCLADGRQVDGWVRAYSEDGKEPMMYIKDATILSADKSTCTDVNGPGILITPAAGITFVQFLDPAD